MFASIRSHARANLIGYLALFVALGGTGAYAANTIGSSDVVDDSLLSEDVKQGSLTRSDVAASTLTGTYVLDGSLSFHDFALGTITNSRLADSAVNSAKVAPNSLTGDDINDSTLINSRVRARARQTGSTSSGSSNVAVNVPLTGNTWTQSADELDQLGGVAVVSAPGVCTQGGGIAFATFEIKLDDEVIESRLINPSIGEFVRFKLPSVVGPGAADARTLTATIKDSCTENVDFTVSGLKIDVVGVR